MTTTWYYAKDKQKCGPVTFAELQHRARTGQLQPTNMVLSAGTSKWVQAVTVEGLFLPMATPIPEQQLLRGIPRNVLFSVAGGCVGLLLLLLVIWGPWRSWSASVPQPPTQDGKRPDTGGTSPITTAVDSKNPQSALTKKRTSTQEQQALGFPSGSGIFLFDLTRPPGATLRDFSWSMTRSDFRKSFGLLVGNVWQQDEGQVIDAATRHYSHSGPLIPYGDVATRYDFQGEELFAVQLKSTMPFTFAPKDFQRNGWALLKGTLQSAFGEPDVDQVPADEQARKVYNFREWRFPAADRVIIHRLFKAKPPLGNADIELENSHITIRKLSVPLTPYSPRWELPAANKTAEKNAAPASKTSVATTQPTPHSDLPSIPGYDFRPGPMETVKVDERKQANGGRYLTIEISGKDPRKYRVDLFPNGKPFSVEESRNNFPAVSKTWWANGRQSSIYYYSGFRKSGTWQFWDTNGTLIGQIDFSGNRPVVQTWNVPQMASFARVNNFYLDLVEAVIQSVNEP